MASTRTARASDIYEPPIKPDKVTTQLLKNVSEEAKSGSVRRYLLEALRNALTDDLNREVNDQRKRATEQEWRPRAEQTWKNGMRTPDDRRLTAWAVFQAHYEAIPYSERPFAHQVRQHPKTKDLYDALCVFVSRNKTKGLKPNSIEDLFPVTTAARGGQLSSSSRRTKR